MLNPHASVGIMKNPNTRLTPAESFAMLTVLDGYQPHQFITTALHFLDLHLPRAMLLPGLELLKKNRLTGKNLADLIVGEFGGDNLEFMRWLSARLVKEDPRNYHLIAGKNFIT